MESRRSRDQMYVTVDLLIVTEKEGSLGMLLSRRTSPPYQSCWALAGRFIGAEESAEDAVENLLEEMLPIDSAYREQLYTFSEVDRDIRGRVISMAYLVIVPWNRLQQLVETDRTSFRCFTLTGDQENIFLKSAEGDMLDPAELAFDHRQIILTGLGRLRGKIEYSDICFHFLQSKESFSLGEVQKVFEAVLNKTMDASNFRRFMLKRYEETGRILQTEMEEKKKRGRPAALYRWIG